MELLVIGAGIFACLVAYFSKYLVNFIKFTRKAMMLPTNKPVPILGHALTFIGPSSGLLKKGFDLIKENEAVFAVWMGPLPVAFITKPEHAEIILGKCFYKGFPYTFLKELSGTGVGTSSGPLWHARRKLVAPAFHYSVLETFLDIFAERSQILVKNLQKEIGSEKFDVSPYIQICALEIILESSMGVQINAEKQKEHADYMDAMYNFSIEMLERIKSPWLYPDFLFYLSPSGRRAKKHLKTAQNFTEKVIQERKEQLKLATMTKASNESDSGKKKILNFLDLLLEISESRKLLTDKDIRDEVQSTIIVGHDTITSAISWCLQMLASHPEVQDKVHEELQKIFGDSNRTPNTRDLNEMKYMEKVIKETLRLYPSGPLIARNLKEDVELDGHILPAGIQVFIPIFYIHHDPALYPDPENFDPDNFLPERVAARHPYAYIPFSAGPRICLGQKYALLEMKIMLYYILRDYKLEDSGEMPIPVPELVLRSENGNQIKIIPRHSSA